MLLYLDDFLLIYPQHSDKYLCSTPKPATGIWIHGEWAGAQHTDEQTVNSHVELIQVLYFIHLI